ncbi:hypothetical protein AAFF_G00188490 [Aldrovandia affinis]|uniref:Uncharacterized protein n=1 Tax=Aldrovandia affinis TaxID=143900 RepID=A0AAD7WVL5_9TELE|nr:hypothetical protein AAFF_G00188490 [Aldrovandia affinis]
MPFIHFRWERAAACVRLTVQERDTAPVRRGMLTQRAVAILQSVRTARTALTRSAYRVSTAPAALLCPQNGWSERPGTTPSSTIPTDGHARYSGQSEGLVQL